MSDIKKILDTLSEMATTSGAVATVSAPLGSTRTRAKGTPSIYGEQIAETEVEEIDTKTDDVVNGVRTPANFGLWQNSYHQADQQKKRHSTKKKVAESRDEPSELDRQEIQDAMKRMKAKYEADPRTKDQEKFSRELGQRLRAAEKRTNKQLDELGNSLMPGGQRALKLAEENLEEGDLIINPFELKRRRSRDIFSKSNNQDHEISMARSDLLQCIKNSEQLLAMLERMSDSDNLEGWVQEKITKATDYLNTVREYLEGVKTFGVHEGEDLSWNDPDLVALRKRHADFERNKKNPRIKSIKRDGYTEFNGIDREIERQRKEGNLKEDSYKSQYPSQEEAIAYAKEQVKSFRDPLDGIEIWAMPDGGADVVHTMNSSGREHAVKNGGKKIGTVRQKQGVAEGRLDEGKGSDVAKALVSTFNATVGGDRFGPLEVTGPGTRVWTRGDGTRHRDPGKIKYENDEAIKKWPGAIQKFWQWLSTQSGVKSIGQVSGEFGSSPMQDAVTYKGLYFALKQNSIAWGSASRVKNPRSVWRQKSPEAGVAEGRDNPLQDIGQNAWHLIQGDKPIAINFPDEARAKSFHSGHGYGKETKVLHGSQVRRNAYLKHNPGVINWPEYSKDVAEGSETAADIDKKIKFHQQGQAAAQKRSKLISDAGGKHLGTLGPRYTKHKMKEELDLDVKTPSLSDIAKKHKVSSEELLSQLKKGIKVELEHTSDLNVAKEIALDHLSEFPDYYDKLERVETSESMMTETEKDACYHKVKSRYKVWPSAYASGALSKCRKVGAKNWGNKSKK